MKYFSIILVGIVIFLIGCNQTGLGNSNSLSSTDTVYVQKVVHDTIHDTIVNNVELLVRESPPYFKEEHERAKLYNKAFCGSINAYKELMDRLTYNQTGGVYYPIGLSYYLAKTGKSVDAYYDCYLAFGNPYFDEDNENRPKKADDDTKKIALYFLQQGAKAGSKLCKETLDDYERWSKEFTDDSFGMQVSKFYYENGKKNVVLRMN